MMIPILTLLIFAVGCEDEPDPEPAEDPIASFQFEIDANDFSTVNFSNFSQNADTYAWDFGDGNSSTDEDPTHTYAAEGTYTVTLTASNSSGTSATFSDSFTITDPNSAALALTGATSKTWKLYREGVSMSLGPDADNAGQWWSGLENDGSRPCAYEQEWTFNSDGTFDFNDNGGFWAEYGVFNNNADCSTNVTAEACITPDASTMVNACGDDITAWGSGSHSFSYDAATGQLTLSGDGAWIGIPKLGTTGETIVPVSEVITQVTITQETGYDLMLVEFIYSGAYWPITYVSYSDASLEPVLETDTPYEPPFGVDLPDDSPTFLGHTFAEAGTSTLDTIASGTGITFGVTDPAGGADLVGEFDRNSNTYQELQFQTSPVKNDIIFTNLTTASVEVYLPSTNDYSGSLTKAVIIGFADASATQEWWTDHQQYEFDGSSLAEDQWHTITFDLNTPSFVANTANGNTPYERNDYDMIFLQIGSGGHTDTGIFYVKNLSIY